MATLGKYEYKIYVFNQTACNTNKTHRNKSEEHLNNKTHSARRLKKH